MGWFSADEIVAPASSTSTTQERNHTAQTVALCVLAALACAYAMIKMFWKWHRQQTERVTQRAMSMANLPNV